MELIIDNRESELIKLFPNSRTANLEFGDVIIKKGDDIYCIFERKTWSDLAASIKDGRYKNQKKGLLENFDVSQIYYIIEGPGDFSNSGNITINGINKNTLLSCIYNSMMRDQIKVFRTANIIDTSEVIKGMFSRLNEHPEFLVKTCEEQIVKQQVTSPEDYFIKALCQIPGISLKTANAIATVYKTFPNFISQLKDNTEKLKVLKEITTIDSKGHKKRISEKVASNIIKFVLDDISTPV